MSSPFKVPDMIRDAATKAGITETLSTAGNISEQPSFIVEVSREVKKAHADGNYTAIEEARRKTSIDFNPILENFRQREENAWVKVKNPSDGVEYFVSFAGPASNPYAYFWQYTYQPATGSNGDPKVQPVQQFGNLSVNGKYMGVSFGLWKNDKFQLSLAAITTLFGYTIADVVEKVGVKAIAENILSSKLWAVVRPLLRSLVYEMIGGSIVGLLIIFIAQFIYKEYKVSITIYNWDLQNDYVIEDSPAGYNEKLDGDKEWEALTIPRPTNSYKPPDGYPIPTIDTIYQYAGYVFINVQQVLAGVGAAIVVKSASDKSKGFALKYLCPFSGKNTLGLTSGVPASPMAYYNDSSSWQSAGTQTMATKIPGLGVDVSCSTPRLQGANDDLYYLDVNIGLKPTDRFGEPPKAEPPNQALPQPRLPDVPQVGSKFKAPDGREVEVIGMWIWLFQHGLSYFAAAID
ncbi:hypothetical protein F5B20DRAFT_591754 [Whalleya microplaca]|nr:hypothetical protein F5B20DRAFT_591754 [Whalleya microplaca]